MDMSQGAPTQLIIPETASIILVTIYRTRVVTSSSAKQIGGNYKSEQEKVMSHGRASELF